MNSRKSLRTVAAAIAALLVYLGLGASAAWAQDYTVSSQSAGANWVTPPSNATNFGLTGDDATKLCDRTNGFPAFDIKFYGRTFDKMYVSTNGFVLFGGGTANGCCSPSSGPFATGNSYDGICASAWSDLYGYPGTLTPVIWMWTDGTAPNRRFIVAWTNWSRCCSYNATINHQLQFYESSGRIVASYTGTWTAGSSTYGVGVDEYSGTRYVRPTAGETSGLYTFTSTPSTDWIFDPKITAFSGKVLMDEVVSDASGYGNTLRQGVPAFGGAVELRNSSGSVLARGFVDANGDYTVNGLALNSSSTGSLVFVTEGVAWKVSPSTPGSPAASHSVQIASNLTFGTSQTIPTFTLNSTTDANGALRKATQIANSIAKMHAWVTARTTDVIGPLEVFFNDTGSTETTRYGSVQGGTLRIGGAASGNLDAYDSSVVMRGYARHVVRAMTGAAATTQVLNLDARTDAVSATADGLGLYVYSLITGLQQAYDATSTSAANVFDLESPTLATAKGPDVGGWFAAAMYDLIDAANESHDQVDGTQGNASQRPFQVFDGLLTLSMLDFVYDWEDAGYNTPGLVKILIHHGILTDDSGEPDDVQIQALDLGSGGQRRTGRTLNPFNEDWYAVTLPTATPALFADLVYDRSATDATVSLEIRNSAGSLLASGLFADATGPMTATAAGAQPGTYFIRVAHLAGGYVGKYDIQVYGQLSVVLDGPTEWTVDRPLVQNIAVEGGIAPFVIGIKTSTPLPGGLGLDTVNSRIFGAPIKTGLATYTITTTDAGSPSHAVTFTAELTVNPPLAFTAPEFNGIAGGKTTDINLGRSGGTSPIVVTNQTGTLPTGLSLDPDFHIRGTTSETGGGVIAFTATDVAGSAANVATTLVVCERHDGKPLPLELTSGDAAAGVYFDAISGSVATINVATAKKRAPRSMSVLIVGPDGQAVVGGNTKTRAGKVQARNVPLPLSGRYFVIFSSADGGAASQIVAGLRVALPRRYSGAAELDFGDEIPLQFGALAGAKLVVSGRTTLRMAMRVDTLNRPDGSFFPNSEIDVDESTGRFKFTVDLDQSGTWSMVIKPRPGPVGEITYKIDIVQPRGVGYSAD